MSEPKAGDKAFCRMCHGPIEFMGVIWTHVGFKPRHPAVPDLGDPSKPGGRSKPYLFEAHTKSKPGKVVMHFVRIETVEFELTQEFDATQFHVIDPTDDPRLAALVKVCKRIEA